MSYILDALKKTEQDRQRGTAPSLNSEHRQGPRRPKRPSWQYLLIIVLLLNAGILLWWLRPWQHGEEEGQQLAVTAKKAAKSASPAMRAAGVRTPAKVVQSSASSTPPLIPGAAGPGVSAGGQAGRLQKNGPREPGQRGAIAEKNTVTMPEVGRRTRQQEKPVSSAKARTQKEKTETVQQRQPVLAAETESGTAGSAGGDVNGIPISGLNTKRGVQSVPHGFKQPAVTGVPPGMAGDMSEHSANLQSGPVSGRKSSHGAGVNAGVTVVGNVLLDYNQLPSSLRQQLPPLIISLHLYADKPERRMASIDGRMYHEKEQIDKDLLVEEITPNGVIFNYAGRKFLKKVF